MYISIQTKYLKKSLEQVTGAKVGKRQLQRELNKAITGWSDLKTSEIQAINVTTQETAKQIGVISVSIGATRIVNQEDNK